MQAIVARFCTISLLTHASKIMIKILQQMIKAKAATVKTVEEDRFGLVKGRGTREATGP